MIQEPTEVNAAIDPLAGEEHEGIFQDTEAIERAHDADDGVVDGEQRSPPVAEKMVDGFTLRRCDDVLLRDQPVVVRLWQSQRDSPSF